MEYKDYYKLMGVDRKATQDEIKRAYRKLARKYHPDVSKEMDAETRFKDLGEANEVLSDPEKRAAYDQLGSNWKARQDFHPPPDWGSRSGFEFHGGSPGGGNAEGFSDFFESLFGQAGRGGGGGQQFRRQGEDQHAKLQIDLEDSYHGASRSIFPAGARPGKRRSQHAQQKPESSYTKGHTPGPENPPRGTGVGRYGRWQGG